MAQPGNCWLSWQSGNCASLEFKFAIANLWLRVSWFPKGYPGNFLASKKFHQNSLKWDIKSHGLVTCQGLGNSNPGCGVPMKKKSVTLVILFLLVIAIYLLVSPIEAKYLNEDVRWMYILNIKELILFLFGLTIGFNMSIYSLSLSDIKNQLLKIGYKPEIIDNSLKNFKKQYFMTTHVFSVLIILFALLFTLDINNVGFAFHLGKDIINTTIINQKPYGFVILEIIAIYFMCLVISFILFNKSIEKRKALIKEHLSGYIKKKKGLLKH